jgi:hypothetical protein
MNWLQLISEFVHIHTIHLECTIKSKTLAREGDAYIMEQVYKLNLLSSEIRVVNYCRLFLDVVSLADITDEQGSYIVAKAWVRLKAHKLSVGNRAQSIQQLPLPQPWTAWRRVLQSFTHPNRSCLKTQLGVWTMDFKSYCTQDAAYIKHAAHTSIHPIKNEVINQNITTAISAIPNDAIPCFISATGDIHTKFGRQTTQSQYRPPQTQHDHLLLVSYSSYGLQNLVSARHTRSLVTYRKTV